MLDKSKSDAWNEGWDAFHDGVSVFGNRYPEGSEENRDWDRGWWDADVANDESDDDGD